MARIGALSLGGRGAAPGAPAVFGVAFDLTRPPASDFIYRPDGTSWEIELKAGQRSVVARTTEVLERSVLLGSALEYAQRCMDIAAYEKRSEMVLADPGGTHVLLFPRDNTLVLQYADVSAVGVSLSGNLTVRDKDGNIKTQQPAPAVWTPGLRFYRLSQSSRDLYDAYRNLFLGLEALLDSLCPKGPDEREWLVRALSTVSIAAGLSELVPKEVTDPVAYVVGTQYDHIRLRLFHAKPSRTGKTLDLPDPEEVGSAYERLIRIWRQIAERCLSVRSGGSSAMTYVGFRMMMDGVLSSGLTMYMTEDDSPFNKDDSAVSPLGKQLYPFQETKYVGETAPGRVAILGSSSPAAGDGMPIVHRIGVSNDRSVLLVGVIIGGLEISGVDVFESVQTLRLRNLGLPKTAFGADPD